MDCSMDDDYSFYNEKTITNDILSVPTECSK